MNTKKKDRRRLSKIVVKDNKLINAKYNFSTLESRLFVLAVSQIDRDDTDLKPYRLYFRDFIEGKFKGDIHARVKEASEALIGRVVGIREEDEKTYTQVPLVLDATYYDHKGYFDIRFHEKIRPYLLQLKEKFTAYSLDNVLPLRGRHSPRIYELLKQYQKIGERTISVEELQEKLEITGHYERYFDFKRYVVLQAQKELTKHCDITFEFQEIKEGRRVDRLRFLIRKNPNFLKLQEDKNDENSALSLRLREMGLTSNQIEQILGEKSEEWIEKVLNEVELRYKETVGTEKEIRNLPAYLFRVLQAEESVVEPKVVKEVKTKEKQAREALARKDAAKAAAEKEKAIIESLRGKYRDYRRILAEDYVKEAREEDWLAFEDHAKEHLWLSKKFINNGKLNREHEDVPGWFGSFLANKYHPDVPETFIEWVHAKHGYQLRLEPGLGEERYRIVGKQENLF